MKAVKIFIAVFFVVAISFFLVSINKNQSKQSELVFLVLPKSEVAVRNTDQLTDTVAQIPFSLSFYNKMLELNSDIEDGASELPDYKRKAFWNGKIAVERVKKSAILKVRLYDENDFQLEVLSTQVAKDIPFVGHKYFNADDLEIRLIDGPIFGQAFRDSYWKAGAKSAGAGVVAGFLVALVFSFVASFFQEKEGVDLKTSNFFNRDFDLSKTVKERDVQYDFQKKAKDKADERIEEMLGANLEHSTLGIDQEIVNGGQREETEEKVEEKLKEVVSMEKKSSSVASLPGADEELPNIFKTDNIEEPTKTPEMPSEPTSAPQTQNSFKEASADEVKARLNKLLKG